MSKKRCMAKRFRSLVIPLTALLIMLVTFPVPSHSQTDISAGKKVYEKYCIGCHGEKGDGNGAASTNLIVKPRNFILGVFKFKSTPTGSLPTDEDLKNVISRGLPTSSMPNFKLVPEADKDKVIAYIKGLSGRWAKESPKGEFTQLAAPDFVGTPDSVKEGERLYSNRCKMCHGTKEGRPDISFALKGNNEECNDLIKPANFNYGLIKRGTNVEDIYLSITAGAEGTPMLSFANMLSENDRWHLTSYILNIMGKGRR
ncbi:MAG: c-type cytochrome [Nitrospirae bacterium]|nr:c-type cytochrome [Nitrospirota bacterium]